MIYAVVFAALATVTAVVIAFALVMRWGMKAKDDQTAAIVKQQDERALRIEANAKAERVTFELEHVKQALTAETKRADTLEGVIADGINTAPSHGLDPRDISSRLLRVVASWRQADAPGSAVPASADAGVPETPLPGVADAASVPPDDDAAM